MATEISRLIEEGDRPPRSASRDRPRHEAEILLGAALGASRALDLLAHPEERILDCDATDRYEAYVTRRAHGEPVAYILGEKEFWSLPLEVTPDVLIPRPETELVVERALAHLPHGSAVTRAGPRDGQRRHRARHRPGAAAAPPSIGTDVSAAAIGVARRNARRLGLGNVEFRVGLAGSSRSRASGST